MTFQDILDADLSSTIPASNSSQDINGNIKQKSPAKSSSVPPPEPDAPQVHKPVNKELLSVSQISTGMVISVGQKVEKSSISTNDSGRFYKPNEEKTVADCVSQISEYRSFWCSSKLIQNIKAEIAQ